jgi:cell division protein ZapE
MQKPSLAYQKKINQKEIQEDLLQKEILVYFDALYDQLTRPRFWLSRSKKMFGIYLFGPVGRGKTMLIDLFIESLPKRVHYQRYHYHAFMRMIHRELKKIQGRKNPLILIAKKIKSDMKVLFLDEFFVMDMANAMILGDLFKALFKEKVIVLTTSNCQPDLLYKDGMFRERFLPAIAAIKKHMQVLSLCCEKDYRMRDFLYENRYFYPDDEKAEKKIQNLFDLQTQSTQVSKKPIMCLNREINIIARNEHIIWFNFNQICTIPRSQNDYLALAQQYQTWMISHVPVFDESNENAGLYFTMLIDVLYDNHKKIIVSASASLENLFAQSGPLALGFERTYSRLVEMQSQAWDNLGTQ